MSTKTILEDQLVGTHPAVPDAVAGGYVSADEYAGSVFEAVTR